MSTANRHLRAHTCGRNAANVYWRCVASNSQAKASGRGTMGACLSTPPSMSTPPRPPSRRSWPPAIAHTLHAYEHDPASDLSYGLEAAAALGVEPEQVFKTLCAYVDGRLCVGIVPVSGQLDLKALAQVLGGKKAEMAPPADAERSSGYVVGGISPIGQRKTVAHGTRRDCRNVRHHLRLWRAPRPRHRTGPRRSGRLSPTPCVGRIAKES